MGKTSTVIPALTGEPGSVPNSEDNNRWPLGLNITLIVFVLFVGVVVIIGAVYRRSRSRRTNNVSYSGINVDNNKTIVHNYYNCNVQTGNKNSMNIRLSVSESESAGPTDEEPVSERGSAGQT